MRTFECLLHPTHQQVILYTYNLIYVYTLTPGVHLSLYPIDTYTVPEGKHMNGLRRGKTINTCGKETINTRRWTGDDRVLGNRHYDSTPVTTIKLPS